MNVTPRIGSGPHAGITNILLVLTFWPAFASALQVTHMPSYDQTNLWGNTYVGAPLSVWCSVTDCASSFPLTCWFSFGDGSTSSTVVAHSEPEARCILQQHVYTSNGLFGISFYLQDAGGFTQTQSFQIYCAPADNSYLARIRKARDDALLWLFTNAVHTGDVAYWQYADFPDNKGSAVGLAVAAFESAGHLPAGAIGTTNSAYSVLLRRAFNYILLNYLEPVGISTNQSNYDPDSNGNGIGLRPVNTRPMYEIGPIISAFACSEDLSLLAPAEAPTGVASRSYADILQDLVDFACWAQSDSGPAQGGWRYEPNVDMDTSASLWPALGLSEAEAQAGAIVPSQARQEVRCNISNWQKPDGSFGYTPDSPSTIARAAFGLCLLNFSKIPITHDSVQRTLEYLQTNFSPPAQDAYARHALSASSLLTDPQIMLFGSTDLLLATTSHLVTEQYTDGHWPGCYATSCSIGNVFGTAVGALILSHYLSRPWPGVRFGVPWTLPSQPDDCRGTRICNHIVPDGPASNISATVWYRAETNHAFLPLPMSSESGYFITTSSIPPHAPGTPLQYWFQTVYETPAGLSTQTYGSATGIVFQAQWMASTDAAPVISSTWSIPQTVTTTDHVSIVALATTNSCSSNIAMTCWYRPESSQAWSCISMAPSGETWSTTTNISPYPQGTVVYFYLKTVYENGSCSTQYFPGPTSAEWTNYLVQPLLEISSVYHTPPSPLACEEVEVYASVTPYTAVSNLQLHTFYRVGTDGNFSVIGMALESNDTYATTSAIPEEASGSVVQYYVRALYECGGNVHTQRSPHGSSFLEYTVGPADDVDVDGWHEPSAPWSNDEVNIFAHVVPHYGAQILSLTSFYRVGTSGNYTGIGMLPTSSMDYVTTSAIPAQTSQSRVEYYVDCEFSGPCGDFRHRFYPVEGSNAPACYYVPRGKPGQVWINELNYVNGFGYSGDTNEFVELAGPAGLDLSGWYVDFVTAKTSGGYKVYASYTITNGAVLTDTGNGFGFFVLGDIELPQADMTFTHTNDFDSTQISDGMYASGVRIYNEGHGLEQAICYAGNIEGFERLPLDEDFFNRTDPYDLQLAGSGTNYSDFSWSTNAMTPGAINAGQTLEGQTNSNPPEVVIVAFELGTTNVTIWSTGTNGWTPQPWYTTNLPASSWIAVSPYWSTYNSGTDTVWFDYPVTSGPCFFRIQSTNAP